MTWQAHRESVQVAKAALADVLEKIQLALTEQDEALSLVAEAVGSPPGTERGQTAFNSTASIATCLQQGLAVTYEARNALDDYTGQF